MSLKRQIEKRDSPLGGFLREVLPSKGNRGLLAAIKEKLNDRETVCLLEGDSQQGGYGLVGHAIDYRVRYHFAHTPADRLKQAQQGAGIVTKGLNRDLARILRTDASRLPGFALTPYGGVPDGEEDWQFLADIEDNQFTIWAIPKLSPPLFTPPVHIPNPELDRTGLSLDCTMEFFDLLDRTVGSIAPHRRQPTREEESEIARFCLVLGVFESERRSGRGWPPSFLGGAAPRKAADLLDAVPDSWAEDVAELAGMFAASRADWRGVSATLNPGFSGSRDVNGGADGDLIVDGCLWDIKTTIGNKAEGNWLYQLLGYVLLDYEDEYAIDSVGFLFPRQDTSIRWPLAELIRELSGQAGISLSDLRQQLRRRLRPDS